MEKGRFEFEFPTMEIAFEKSKRVTNSPVASDESRVDKEINSYTTQIFDVKNNATIRIYKIKDLVAS